MCAPPRAYGRSWCASRRAPHRRPAAPTNVQQPSSRRYTAARTAAGTCRERRPEPRAAPGASDPPSGPSPPGFTAPAPKRRFLSCSQSTDSARSTTVATSPPGFTWLISALASSSLSTSICEAAKDTLYRPDSPLTAVGSRRTEVAASGRGNHRATTSSTSRLLFPDASAISARWFSAVSRGASSSTALRCSRPSRTASTTAGSRRPTRAAHARSYAAPSLIPSASTQQACIDEYPSRAHRLRASTSPRCTSSAPSAWLHRP